MADFPGFVIFQILPVELILFFNLDDDWKAATFHLWPLFCTGDVTVAGWSQHDTRVPDCA